MLILFVTFLSFAQISVYADDAASTYKDAVKYLKNGSEEFAIAKFSHIVQWNKESKYRDEALFRVGEYYFKLKGFIDAERALDKHLSTYVDSPFKGEVINYLCKIKSIQGDNLYNTGKWHTALEYYEEAITFNENNIMLKEKIEECKLKISHEKLIEQGDALYQEAKYNEALGVYTNFLEMYPNNSSVEKKIENCRKELELEKERKEFAEWERRVDEAIEKGEYTITMTEVDERQWLHSKAIQEKQAEEVNKRLRADSTDYDEICIYAHAAVRSQLKSPSSAQFSYCDKNTVKNIAPGEYLLSGTVDSENSYGGMGRNEWQVLLKKDLLQDYVLKDIAISEFFIR